MTEELLESAVQVAKVADAVIAVVGLNGDWYALPAALRSCSDAPPISRESEGYDRAALDLPGRTNELIQRVAGVNPNTIVVTQSVRVAATADIIFLLRSLDTI